VLWEQGGEHARLVALALLIAVPAAVLLGTATFSRPRLAAAAVGFAGVLFTVPSLALFGFFVAPLGLGTAPSVAALSLYSLLPVLRNTVVGLTQVPADVVEAAVGMGMSQRQVLLRVRLPLALPVVAAGVRVASVAVVGIATIAVFVAGGGLGRTVLDGLNGQDRGAVLAAAACIGALAFAFDGAFALVERLLTRRLGGGR
jgi:osmoprotectant transport system permease protein